MKIIKSIVILLFLFSINACVSKKNISVEEYEKYFSTKTDSLSFRENYRDYILSLRANGANVLTIGQYRDTLVNDLNKGEVSGFLQNLCIDKKTFSKEKLYYRRSCDYSSDLKVENKTFMMLLFDSLEQDDLSEMESLLQTELMRDFNKETYCFKKKEVMYRHYMKLIRKQLLCRYMTINGEVTF